MKQQRSKKQRTNNGQVYNLRWDSWFITAAPDYTTSSSIYYSCSTTYTQRWSSHLGVNFTLMCHITNSITKPQLWQTGMHYTLTSQPPSFDFLHYLNTILIIQYNCVILYSAIHLEPTKGRLAELTRACSSSMPCTWSGVTCLSCTVRLLSSSHTLSMLGWNILVGSRIRTCNDRITEHIGGVYLFLIKSSHGEEIFTDCWHNSHPTTVPDLSWHITSAWSFRSSGLPFFLLSDGPT